MASIELRRFDTYPPIGVLLDDSSSAPGIDLTTASSIKYELKGVTAPLITGVCTVAQVAIVGTTSNNSTTLSSVSPTTGYVNTATLTGPNIPAGTTIISGAGTATLTMSNVASGPGTVTIIVNQGLVNIPFTGALSGGFSTADLYTGECEIHWSAGGVQTVPNAFSSDFTIQVDLDEESA